MTIITLGRRITPSVSFATWLKTAQAMAETKRQRRELARLDARALADMGLTQAQVAAELRKPLWDLSGQFNR